MASVNLDIRGLSAGEWPAAEGKKWRSGAGGRDRRATERSQRGSPHRGVCCRMGSVERMSALSSSLTQAAR
jgi:hypothetical protein